MLVTRINDNKVKAITDIKELEELYNLFFNRYHSLKKIYNTTVENYAEVLKMVLDCKYLSDLEVAAILKFLAKDTELNEENLYNTRYLGKKRLQKVQELQETYEIIIK